MIKVNILPEKNVIDDGFLDLIGREFATHEQGLAEWLKNAADATESLGFCSEETFFLRFADGGAEGPPAFECIDFVGMTLDDIERAFKPWGRVSGHGVYGGYGIGGKFYMRQMFESSYVMTYRRGFLNIFGFDRNRFYGYGQGWRNHPVNIQKAMELAGVEPLAAMAGVKDAIVGGGRGFSVVRGIGPRGVPEKIDVKALCRTLGDHPQAQSVLKFHRVCVIHNGAVLISKLNPRFIPRRQGLSKPWVREIPPRLPRVDDQGGDPVDLSCDSRPPGRLCLFVARDRLLQPGKMASLNRIDFLGRHGTIASYRIDELGIDVPYSDYIFGECFCPILEGIEEPSAKKSRDKLIDNARTRALLRWIGVQVSLFSDAISRQGLDPKESRKKRLPDGSTEGR